MIYHSAALLDKSRLEYRRQTPSQYLDRAGINPRAFRQSPFRALKQRMISARRGRASYSSAMIYHSAAFADESRQEYRRQAPSQYLDRLGMNARAIRQSPFGALKQRMISARRGPALGVVVSPEAGFVSERYDLSSRGSLWYNSQKRYAAGWRFFRPPMIRRSEP